MLADTGGSTWYMCVAGEYGFFVIAVFLFITFGNGFRFGRRYLFSCQLLSLTGLVAVLLFVPYWQEHRIPGIGLLIALIVLPLYVSTLLKRIQEARAKAEEANIAKTTFLAHMSHEMRTPLNGIVGVVDLLKTTDLSGQQTELVQLLRHSIAVLRSLVDDVLDISKIEAGRLSIEVTSFDLHAAINSLVQLLRPHAQSKGLHLYATVDPELDYKLRGDPHHIRQILLNLLGNAVKFTEHGEVTLRALRRRESADGITVRFEVIDTGIGIALNALPRIFERFVQADQSTTRRFGGSGLGTTIAKQLVELMGGTIGVESVLGQGSTFWFELPLLRDEPANGEISVRKQTGISNARTLLVADTSEVRGVSELLLEAGEQVEVVASTDSVGSKLDGLLASGISLRAIVASCSVDIACTAFASTRQRIGDKPLGIIYIARGPLSVVDNARLRSIREACVLDTKPTPRTVANAIHAAIASSGREGAEVLDLNQLIERKRSRLKILVAEDNQTNQAIMSKLLTSAGHQVVLVSDGEQALDAYEQERPDVAILDYNMPYRTGVEVVQAIRLMEPVGRHMPTIILSASVTVEARQRALHAGADDFIGKPFDATALLEKLDDMSLMVQVAKVPDAATNSSTAVISHLQLQRSKPTTADLVDAARLAELEDIARDSRFMTELLRGFRTDVELILRRMDESVATGELSQLGDLIHSLKGAAVGVGATGLATKCDEFSQERIHAPERIARVLVETKRCFDATLRHLDNYVRQQHKVSL